MNKKIQMHTQTFYKWRDLVNAVEEKSGKSIRDWAGKFKKNSSFEDYPVVKWAIKHGYDPSVLNDPVDENGLKLRIEINTTYKDAEDGFCKEEIIEYQDFWHYALDHIFENVANGCIKYFCPQDLLDYLEENKDEDEINGDYKNLDWVREILRYFVEVFKENDLPEEVNVKFSW